MQQAGADRVVRQAVDQDEAAGIAVLAVGVEGDRAVEREVADADLVQLELLAARCSRVLTLTRYFRWVIVAVTVFAPIFNR